jgi:hypothetical protein
MPTLREISKALSVGNYRAKVHFRFCFYPHEYAMTPNKQPRIYISATYSEGIFPQSGATLPLRVSR